MCSHLNFKINISELNKTILIFDQYFKLNFKKIIFCAKHKNKTSNLCCSTVLRAPNYIFYYQWYK